MNESQNGAKPWRWEQKVAVVCFAALAIGWFSSSNDWKYTFAGKGLYLVLLAAFGVILYLFDRQAWAQIKDKPFFFGLLAAWLALFQWLGNSLLGYIHTPSLFSWMYEAYNRPGAQADDAHGDLIPFLVVGLLWWKRKELLAQPLNLWRPALGLMVLAMALHILGFDAQQPRISILALFTGIYGLMGLAWGPGWLKKSFFPFFLCVFCVPLGSAANAITFPLRLLVSWLTEKVAHGIGIDVIRHGNLLFDPSGTFQYEVAAACSGIRSLVAIFLLATVFGFLTFRSNGRRLLLMALAFPFAVLGNLLRMLCIIGAAEFGGQEAGSYVHESTWISLIPYLPAIIGLLWLGRWMERRWPEDQAAGEGGEAPLGVIGEQRGPMTEKDAGV